MFVVERYVRHETLGKKNETLLIFLLTESSPGKCGISTWNAPTTGRRNCTMWPGSCTSSSSGMSSSFLSAILRKRRKKKCCNEKVDVFFTPLPHVSQLVHVELKIFKKNSSLFPLLPLFSSLNDVCYGRNHRHLMQQSPMKSQHLQADHLSNQAILLLPE